MMENVGHLFHQRKAIAMQQVALWFNPGSTGSTRNQPSPTETDTCPAPCAEQQVFGERALSPIPETEPTSSDMAAIVGLSAKRRVLLEPDSLTDLRTGAAASWRTVG